MPDASVVLQVQTGPGIADWSGRCYVDSSGCVTDGGGNYGNDEQCTIRVLLSGTLTATQFDTENGFDWVTIGGTRYMGTAGPVGVGVAAGSTLTWRSDHSVTRAGWTICLSE